MQSVNEQQDMNRKLHLQNTWKEHENSQSDEISQDDYERRLSGQLRQRIFYT
jgi:hypothetical protein